MKIISLFTLISISLLLTACAGKPTNGATTVASNQGKICRYEKTTGTRLGTKICRTPQQMEHEKKVAKEMIRGMQTSSPTSGG